MIIEVGKTYKVSNQVKKAVVESEYFNAGNGQLIEVQTTWRYGEYLITPSSEEEVQMLRDDSEENFCVSDFEEWEMLSTFDGISVDYYFHWNVTEDVRDVMTEAMEEDGYWNYLEENGYEPESQEVWIYDGINIEEADANESYNH